jgi:hypothetical protein
MIEVSIMAAHGQAKSMVEAITEFGKKEVISLTEQSFLELLVSVMTFHLPHLLIVID